MANRIRESRRGRAATVLGSVCLMALACGDGNRSRGIQRDRVISDQVHNGGVPGFFWLPPIAPATTYGAAFQAGESPIVTVEQLPLGSRAPLATFTTSSGMGGAIVTSDGVSQYHVNWDTKAVPLDPGERYRIRVVLGNFELGFADVDVVASGSELRNVATGEFIPVLDGRTLPIKFRVEPAAMKCVNTECKAQDACHHAGVCDPFTGACSNPVKPDDTPCDDRDRCTHTDVCRAGTCTGTDPVACAAVDECHEAGKCDPATGQCSSPPKPGGAACSDGDGCTQQDACDGAGACVGSDPVVCAPAGQCLLAGACEPSTGTCKYPAMADGTSCDDGTVCTSGDTCLAGVCTGQVLDCSDGDGCTYDGCNPEQGCIHVHQYGPLCAEPVPPDDVDILALQMQTAPYRARQHVQLAVTLQAEARHPDYVMEFLLFPADPARAAEPGILLSAYNFAACPAQEIPCPDHPTCDPAHPEVPGCCDPTDPEDQDCLPVPTGTVCVPCPCELDPTDPRTLTCPPPGSTCVASCPDDGGGVPEGVSQHTFEAEIPVDTPPGEYRLLAHEYPDGPFVAGGTYEIAPADPHPVLALAGYDSDSVALFLDAEETVSTAEVHRNTPFGGTVEVIARGAAATRVPLRAWLRWNGNRYPLKLWDGAAGSYADLLELDLAADEPASIAVELAMAEALAEPLRLELPPQSPAPAQVELTLNESGSVVEAPCTDAPGSPPLCRHVLLTEATLFVLAPAVPAGARSLMMAQAEEPAATLRKSYSKFASVKSYIGAGVDFDGSATFSKDGLVGSLTAGIPALLAGKRFDFARFDADVSNIRDSMPSLNWNVKLFGTAVAGDSQTQTYVKYELLVDSNGNPEFAYTVDIPPEPYTGTIVVYCVPVTYGFQGHVYLWLEGRIEAGVIDDPLAPSGTPARPGVLLLVVPHGVASVEGFAGVGVRWHGFELGAYLALNVDLIQTSFSGSAFGGMDVEVERPHRYLEGSVREGLAYDLEFASGKANLDVRFPVLRFCGPWYSPSICQSGTYSKSKTLFDWRGFALARQILLQARQETRFTLSDCTTCESAAAGCGTVADPVCGGSIQCGECGSDGQCVNNTCVPCTPLCPVLATGACGTVVDSCGRTHVCGPETCPGAGTCVDNVCLSCDPIDCDDNNPCTKDECNIDTCVHTPMPGVACTDDGNPCTADVCGGTAGTTCVHNATPGVACTDDGNPCTADVCGGTAGTTCVHNGTPGVACTDDGNPCTVDVCGGTAGTTCVHDPNSGAACNDGVFCNGADTCSGSLCAIHAGDPCSYACDESADRCVCAANAGQRCGACSKYSCTGVCESQCSTGQSCCANGQCCSGQCNASGACCAPGSQACGQTCCPVGECLSAAQSLCR